MLETASLVWIQAMIWISHTYILFKCYKHANISRKDWTLEVTETCLASVHGKVLFCFSLHIETRFKRLFGLIYQGTKFLREISS